MTESVAMAKGVTISEMPTCAEGDISLYDNLDDAEIASSMSQLARALSTHSCGRCASGIIELSRAGSGLNLRANNDSGGQAWRRIRSGVSAFMSLLPSQLASAPVSALSPHRLASALESSELLTRTPSQVRKNLGSMFDRIFDECWSGVL